MMKGVRTLQSCIQGNALTSQRGQVMRRLPDLVTGADVDKLVDDLTSLILPVRAG